MFRIEDCGYPSDKMVLPVSMLTSLKGWHREFIFVQGGDLEFKPLHKLEIKTDRFPVQLLDQEALAMVYTFCKALGTQWTGDTFNSNENMHAAGCIPKLIPYPPNMSAQRKSAPAGSGERGGEGSEVHISKKAAVELALDTPETLKALLASFTPETRRKELFKNYASTVERKKYRKEPLDDFLVGLQEEITATFQFIDLDLGPMNGDIPETHKEKRKTVIVTAAVHRGFGHRLPCHQVTNFLDLPALGRRQPPYMVLRLYGSPIKAVLEMEANAKEAGAYKKLLDEIRERQDRAEASVREMRAENNKLKDELPTRPTPKKF
ncbi:hypothetical protein AgCh_022567 [Apium graveolens]